MPISYNFQPPGIFRTPGTFQTPTPKAFVWSDPTIFTDRTTVLQADAAWEAQNVQEPSVIANDTNPIILTGNTTVWKMWYSGGWSQEGIGYAESLDGVTWTKYSGNPVLWSDKTYAQSFVWKYNDTYYMLANYWFIRIDLFTSADGITWTLAKQGVVTPTLVTGDFDAWDTGNSAIFLDSDGIWKMLYEALGVYTNYEIGLMTTPDLQTWTRYSSHALITMNPVGAMRGGPSNIIKQNGEYYVFVHGSPIWGGASPTDIYLYKSPDFHIWEQTSLGSIFPRLLPDEVSQVSDPEIVDMGSYVRLYYSATTNGGSQSGNFHIKIATANMSMTELLQACDYISYQDLGLPT